MVRQPVYSVCRGNDCLVFSRLLRTQSIYIIYNTFHTWRASSATKNPPTTASPPAHCRFIGLTHSLVSPERGHFSGDARQQSTLTVNSDSVCLGQRREFKARTLEQKSRYCAVLSWERCPHNLRTPRSQHQKRAESWKSTLKVSLFSVVRVWCQPIPE